MNGTNSTRSTTTIAEFASPRTDRPLTLAVIADPHVCVGENANDKLFQSMTAFERTIADIDAQGVDYALSVGDLTLDGATAEYDIVDDILENLSAPFVSIPGNHDVRNTFDLHPGISTEEFIDRYAPGELPFVIETRDLAIIGLDSSSADAVADSHDGYVDPAQADWLDDTLKSVDEAIVLVHHNLPGALAQFDDYRQAVNPSLGTPPVLREPNTLVDILSANDVPLVFTGHLHIPAFATTDGVREVLVPSVSTYPQGYFIVEIDQRGTTVEYVPVATTREATTAYTRRSRLKPKAKALTSMAAARLSALPLFEE